MSTFLGQLGGFALIVFAFWKWILPLVRRLMADRQETVRTQLDESAEAKKRLAEAEGAHAKAIEQAHSEAEVVVEEARADAERITAQLRAQADVEVQRVKVQGEKQIELLRAQLIRQLRSDLGNESVRRAGELVRDHVADETARSATVDRMLDELDAMAPSNAVVRSAVTEKLRSASRESLGVLVGRFDRITSGLDSGALTALADDLTAVAKLLSRESILTRHLADPADDPSPKVRLVETVLGNKVGQPALDVVKAAVSGRWSADADLVYAVEHVARLALLVRAEREGQVDEVEDQLFRFSRILDAEPQLCTLLSDFTRPAEGRVRLLDDILDEASGASPIAAALVRQTVELLHGGRADEAVKSLTELAVARRGEVVAHVGAAAPLTAVQRDRLGEVLARIYSHPVSVQLHVNPELLGGLSISVGDEVIDGTLASRLAAADTHLPD